MRISSLEAYGVHPDLTHAWIREYGEELLPIQERAVVEGDVLRGGSVVGVGPTGCGKTLIAEMAALHAATRGRRAIYLAPTKALAEAVYAHFRHAYGPLGVGVEISTRDRRGSDVRMLRGDFDVMVTVPEKLWSVMLEAPGLVGTVGALVVDELQLVGDPERGPCLEALLARFLAAGSPQIVVLSAVLSNGSDLADWLGARLIEEKRRPVELRKGVWSAGRFTYFEHNSGLRGEEKIEVEAEAEPGSLDAVVALAAELASRGEPTLVFLRDRISCVRAARMAAQRSRCPGGERALAALADLPRTEATTTLGELMQSGVAFHNADLHHSERQVVEEAFSSDDVLCLFATTTLSVGVNLPARNVIVEPLTWYSRGGGPSLSPLPQSDFENMAGRAGRLGFGDPFGRAILVAAGGFEADGLMRRYVQTGPEPVEGQMSRLPALQQALMVAAIREGSQPIGGPRLFSRLEAQNEEGHGGEGEREAEALGLLQQGSGRLTALGRAAAASGLCSDTVERCLRALRTLGRTPTNLEALILASQALEARAVPIPRDRSGQRWLQVLEDQVGARMGWTDQARALLWAAELTVAEREAAARIAALTMAWSSPEASAELELRTGVHAGRALALCESVGWTVQCLARFSAEMGGEANEVLRLQSFGEALAAGLPEACLGLRHLRLTALQRDHILALSGAGLDSPQAVLNAPEARLRQLLPHRAVQEIRSAAGSRWAPEVSTATPTATTPGEAPLSQQSLPTLVLDDERPDIAIVYGHEVSLRPMEFRLLRALAQRPRRCVSLDDLYRELWGPHGEVEPGQIHWHRHKLAEKLAAVQPPGSAPMIRTLPRRGLMLDLPAEEVAA